MIKKAIVRGTTYEVGDFHGEGVIVSMRKEQNVLSIVTSNDYLTFALRDGDFLKYEDDSIETFKLGGHEDGDDL